RLPVAATDPGALGDLLDLLLLRRLFRPGEGARRLGEIVDVERELVRDALERLPLQGFVIVCPRPEEQRQRALERRGTEFGRLRPRRAELQRPAPGERQARRSEYGRERQGEPEEETRRHAITQRG